MGQSIKVGIADLNIASYPDSLITLGLGSCIGIALYDPISKIGGLVHIMLPDSTKFSGTLNLAKFADTGIPELVRLMEAKGATKSRIVAKIAGGAQMFEFARATDIMKVGDRNIEAVLKTLKELNIPLLSKDVGERYGRTVEFFTETGMLNIRTIGYGERQI